MDPTAVVAQAPAPEASGAAPAPTAGANASKRDQTDWRPVAVVSAPANASGPATNVTILLTTAPAPEDPAAVRALTAGPLLCAACVCTDASCKRGPGRGGQPPLLCCSQVAPPVVSCWACAHAEVELWRTRSGILGNH